MRLKLRSPRAAWAMAAVVMTLVAVLFYANLTGSDEPIEHALPHRFSACDPQFRSTTSHLLGPEVVHGNRITTLLNGDQAFPAMLEAIRSAQHSISFEGYIFWSGTIAHALPTRSQSGPAPAFPPIWCWTGSARTRWIPNTWSRCGRREWRSCGIGPFAGIAWTG